jgi:hypothetical protein
MDMSNLKLDENKEADKSEVALGTVNKLIK